MQNGDHLTIRGKRFHCTWLRDHCLCPEYFHQGSSQKIYDISMDPVPPEPRSVEETSSELRISWNGARPHESVFPIRWLLEHSYDPAPGPEQPSETVLWDAAYTDAHPPGLFDVSSTPFESWGRQLAALGFAVIHKTFSTPTCIPGSRTSPRYTSRNTASLAGLGRRPEPRTWPCPTPVTVCRPTPMALIGGEKGWCSSSAPATTRRPEATQSL